MNNVRHVPSPHARTHPCAWHGRRRLSAGRRDRAMSRRLTAPRPSPEGRSTFGTPSRSGRAQDCARPDTWPKRTSRREKQMAKILVTADDTQQGTPAVLLEESVSAVHLSTDHAAMQLIE